MRIEEVLELTGSIVSLLQNQESIDENYLLGAISSCIESLKRKEDHTLYYPVKDAFAAQHMGQILWNTVVQKESLLKNNSPCRRSLRYLSTLLFLHGNNVFAKKQLRDAYFQCHPKEGEKCLLLCLRTAKDFCECGDTSVASELLSLTSSVRESCILKHQKSVQFDIEILFAEMAIHKELHQWDKVVEKTEIIFGLCCSRWPQKEAILHFIFCLGESEKSQPESEIHLRKLLSLSLSEQRNAKTCSPFSIKEGILYGATCIQMAMSFLRSGMHAEALEFAELACNELQSSEPLVIKVSCLSALKRTEDAVKTFRAILSYQTFSLKDIFSIAFGIAEMDSMATGGVLDCLRSHSASFGNSEEYALYFFSFVTQFNQVECVSEVLFLLNSRVDCAGPLSHTFFQLLWSYSQNTKLGAENQISVLCTALKFSKNFDGSTERECVINILGQIAIEAYENNEIHSLDIPLSVYSEQNVEEYSLLSKIIFFQILFLSGRDISDRELEQLLERHCSDGGFVDACGSLCLFLIEHDAIHLASCLSKIVLALNSDVQNDRAAFLKIFALSLLHSSSLEEADVLLITQNLNSSSVASIVQDDAVWWCRFLWHIGDCIQDENRSLALRVYSAGIDLWIRFISESNPDAIQSLLVSRYNLVLDLEFELFVHGHPVLSTEQIKMYTSNIEIKNLNVIPTIVYLSKCESSLRTLQDEAVQSNEANAAHCADLVSIDNISRYGCTREDCESLSIAILTTSKVENIELRKRAVQILLFCVSNLGSKKECDREDFLFALRSLYRAYNLSNDVSAQREVCDALVRVVNTPRFTPALSSDTAIQTIIEFFAVETWNTAVKYNIARENIKVNNWKDLTKIISGFLNEGNYTKSILLSFLEKMPVL